MSNLNTNDTSETNFIAKTKQNKTKQNKTKQKPDLVRMQNTC